MVVVASGVVVVIVVFVFVVVFIVVEEEEEVETLRGWSRSSCQKTYFEPIALPSCLKRSGRRRP